MCQLKPEMLMLLEADDSQFLFWTSAEPQLKVRKSQKQSGRILRRGQRVGSMGETMLNVKLRGRCNGQVEAIVNHCKRAR